MLHCVGVLAQTVSGLNNKRVLAKICNKLARNERQQTESEMKF